MNITKTYGVTVEVYLKAVFWHRWPTVRVSLDNEVKNLVLSEDTMVSFVKEAHKDDVLVLKVEHWGKTPSDHNLVENVDTAVIIDRIVLNGLESPRFVWQGQYTPQYDVDYVKECKNLGIELEPVLKNSNYLGWNGVWCLEFTAPVFAWVHRLENLGWIYD